MSTNINDHIGRATGDRDEDQATGCELCGGVLIALGRLGRVIHFRCQDCGMDWREEMSEGDYMECLTHEKKGEN